MKAISLTQVSVLVVLASMASFFSNANNVVSHEQSNNKLTDVATSIVDGINENSEQHGDRFTFTSLDTDKDGKLNQQEVIAGNNEWLMQSFKKIDINIDDSLTEQELVEFVTRSNLIIQ